MPDDADESRHDDRYDDDNEEEEEEDDDEEEESSDSEEEDVMVRRCAGRRWTEDEVVAALEAYKSGARAAHVSETAEQEILEGFVACTRPFLVACLQEPGPAELARLARLHRDGVYPHAGVVGAGRRLLTFDAWAARIAHSFHRCFYVPLHAADDAAFDIDARLVNRRGIYKDAYRSSGGWTDYQLRPNFLVAMAVAPELFAAHPAEAAAAVAIAQRQLCGPLGMRTLDPDDWAYRGNYHNSDDSTDRTVAAGFNYHQGPEWLWPFGCFLQALIRFGRFPSPDARDAAVYTLLQPHVALVQSPPWYGLPELTNANGAFCPDSCRTQAWSFATILEALHLLHDFNDS